MGHKHEHNHAHDHAEHNHDHSEGEESNQELEFKASLLERHIQDLTEKIEYVAQQLAELEEFNKNMKFLKNSKGKETFASIGRGIYVKSSSSEDKLFVNVGAGVIVKKTPEETTAIIEKQIVSFHEAKTSLIAQLEVYKGIMNQTIASLDQAK